MFEVTSTWNKELALIPAENKTIYFSEEYIKSYEYNTIIAEAFIYTSGDDCFIFPYLKQYIESEEEYWDFETPYGYGGPLSSSYSTEFLKEAWSSFNNYMEDNFCLAAFIRFDPVINNIDLMAESGFVTLFDRNTVSIDLRLSEEDIFTKEIHSKHRNVIRKAEKAGLEFVVDSEFKYFPEFVEIYTQTMERLSADAFYHFDTDYYTRLINGLKDNSFLSVVKLDGQIISTAIIMVDELNGHYHLAGSRADFLSYSPNNFLLYKTALYLKSLGKAGFHIGGGTSSDSSNSLFKFKKRFSKSLKDFHIGKKVFSQQKYEQVCQNWEKQNPGKVEKFKNMVLKYRF